MSVILFIVGVVPKRLAANVCVSAVVRFRSCVLSHETKCGTKIKTYSVHLTAPLQKHFVASSWVFQISRPSFYKISPSWFSGIYNLIIVFKKYCTFADLPIGSIKNINKLILIARRVAGCLNLSYFHAASNIITIINICVM